MNQSAILIVLNIEATESQVKAFLAAVRAAEQMTGVHIEQLQSKPFNPDYGGVTIYQP